jgi:Right handed beta helix region/Pectate lyase superfamily protein
MRWYGLLSFLLLLAPWAAPAATPQDINVTQEPYLVPHDGKGDASTGINRALADAQGKGRTVYLPCGTYRLIAEVLPKSHTALRGAGDCTILMADPSLPIPRPIKVENQTQVSIHDLQVDCGDATVGGRQGVALMNSTTYTTVAHVHVQRCGQYGIAFGDNIKAPPYGSGGAGIVWRNNRVDMTGIPAGKCTGTIAMEYFPKGPLGYLAAPGPLIEGNVVIGATADQGIKFSNSRGARIVSNNVSGVTCSTAAGAIATPASEEAVIERNTISDTRLGIVFGGSLRPNATGGNELRVAHLAIRGNTIRRYSVSGIFSSDGANDVAIVGNMIALDGGTGARAIDMQPQPASKGGAAFTQVEIAKNVIQGGVGIDLRTDREGTLGFRGVHITGNTLQGVPASGIRVQHAPE